MIPQFIRLGAASPSAFRAFKWLLAFNLLLIALAIFLGIFKYSDKSSPTRYFGEGRFPTVASILQLAATGAICAAVFARRRQAGGASAARRPSFIWLAFAAGFVFLALDEWLEIHENLDGWIHKYVLQQPPTNLTDRIDDFIIIGYGGIGLGLIVLFRRELTHFGPALPYLAFAFVASVLSVGADAVSNREDLISGPLHTWVTVGDDVFKLLAEAGFLAASVAALTLARDLGSPLRTSPEGPKKPSPG
ncbi:hypothetical protein BH23VER1_BH23VER1_02260 [soil metagenome]